ncbi:glycosyl hydrolase catalytic core-domain-containing protein [Colletotrichum godetiae]|uniref:Glycosyl hydrolase catalytic core-domain-containing protein n=1 Tax=Colletotrichum godetiae TaxID=1209918 RepID=A0AAJ0A826_9PEZI|nr:glycosyl hydrolase catalytic core-domain-containing protein [Colletotrichum godetiae]KAK1656786.1 glycosyl hydrolase catalytic core-domain-containing protein [Colletotrichum godetiae]
MRRTSRILLASLALHSTAFAQSDLPSKRGLAFQGDDHTADSQLLTSAKSLISWYYTWSTWPAQVLNSSIAFVPLIHGVDDASDSGLSSRLSALPGSSTHLLTFNEPDGTTSSGGSSIDPEDAAKAYIEHIVPFRNSGSRKWNISHPVVTGSSQGIEWLQKFNESCYDIDDNGCPTDFVAVHWYGDATGLKNHLDGLRDFYNSTSPDLKYWITEMALPKQDTDATLAMMNESLAYLDGLDYVEGYAWFGAFRKDEANAWTGNSVSLFDGDGGLTDLGALYLGGDEQGFEKGQKGEGNFASSLSPGKALLWTAILTAITTLW